MILCIHDYAMNVIITKFTMLYAINRFMPVIVISIFGEWAIIPEGVGYIVAKCPGLAGTVPEFGPMSRLCPGLPDLVAISRNPARMAQIIWVWHKHKLPYNNIIIVVDVVHVIGILGWSSKSGCGFIAIGTQYDNDCTR